MRSTFSSSRLVRLLGDWTPVQAQPSSMDVAERLSLWVGAFDAIGLQAAHQAIATMATAAPGKASAGPRAAQALADDLDRVRGALANAIAQDPVPRGDAASHAPYRERHLKLQWQMDQLIAPLRDHVRQTISAISPSLRQLAALDAVLQHVLGAREQTLLPAAVALMERRFQQLRQAHAEPDAASAPDDPAPQGPDGWRERFLGEWRQVLLAEVELRLEPVAGLIDALGHAMKNRT